MMFDNIPNRNKERITQFFEMLDDSDKVAIKSFYSSLLLMEPLTVDVNSPEHIFLAHYSDTIGEEIGNLPAWVTSFSVRMDESKKILVSPDKVIDEGLKKSIEAEEQKLIDASYRRCICGYDQFYWRGDLHLECCACGNLFPLVDGG